MLNWMLSSDSFQENFCFLIKAAIKCSRCLEKSLNYRRKLQRLRSRIHRVVDYRGASWLWKPISVQSRMFTWSIKPVEIWITMKSRLVRTARETSKLHIWSPFINSRRRFMTEVLLIRCKTLYNQSINHRVVLN